MGKLPIDEYLRSPDFAYAPQIYAHGRALFFRPDADVPRRFRVSISPLEGAASDFKEAAEISINLPDASKYDRRGSLETALRHRIIWENPGSSTSAGRYYIIARREDDVYRLFAAVEAQAKRVAAIGKSAHC